MYRVYVDFMSKIVLAETKTRKEAYKIRKEYPKHSEVWVEKVENVNEKNEKSN